MSAPDALSSEYLQWLTVEKGRSRATIEAYRRDIRAFMDLVGEHKAAH